MIKRHLFTLLSILAITLLSLIPVPEVPQLADVPLFDKWVHFVMYGWLSAIMWWESCTRKEATRNRGSLPSLLLLNSLFPALLGGLLELGQAYLTTCRSGDWWDFLADAIGALLGTLIGLLTYHIYDKYK